MSVKIQKKKKKTKTTKRLNDEHEVEEVDEKIFVNVLKILITCVFHYSC